MMATVAETVSREEQLVAFVLAGETYGIDIALVQEIIRMREVTQIPGAAPDIEGVINLRGKIVPILDLRKRLGLPPTERATATRIVVVEVAEYTVGMVVDDVTGVLRLPQSAIEPPAQLIADLNEDFIRGVGKCADQIIILLDMAKTLSR